MPLAAGDNSLLHPLALERPDASVFPLPAQARHLPPFGTEVDGAKATNKFWANWVVEEGRELSIHAMPYVLRYDASTGQPNMKVSRASSDARVMQYGDSETNGGEKIRYYFSPFVSEFGLSALEVASQEGQTIVKEGLFGVHAEVRGPSGTGRKILFPIYSGMAYVSGFYTGFTPKISSDRALLVVERVSNGIWRLLNNGGKEFRLYALDASGAFADESFDFTAQGTMTKAFEGWIRLAEVQAPEDRDILDFHAAAVLVDWHLELEADGLITYRFTKDAAVPKQVLHFANAHHQKLLAGNTQVVTQLTPLAPPTKGLMKGVAGDLWHLQVNVSETRSLGFLPDTEPDSSKEEDLKQKAYGTLQFFLHSDQWKQAMFKGSYYFSGKGFQKVAYTCLMLEKYYGKEHSHTQSCANLLIRGFQCLYAPTVPECNGAPLGLYYDEEWHGVASREGFSDIGCRNADFGNACYNDHHYHFSYYVVSAAVLVKLKPEFAQNQDTHFPQFRSFDWFDLHSWSRGVIPSADGKDQESTSEELNLLYGIHLWGMVLQREPLRELGTTMLTLCAMTIREFFLMKEDNPHHPEDFVTNHVTGIFFQNKVDYATWFGWRYDFIHGIQMLPVTPALLMIRTPEFCRQEWDNILSRLPLSPTDPWTSLLVTGTLAIIEPEEAYQRLNAMLPEHMDDGLTWAWALYWSASLSGTAGAPSTSLVSSTGSTGAAEENLALYRLAVASSELSADFAAARAVDGLFVTRWSPTVAELSPWISVDLGAVHALSHVVLLWGEFYPSSYLLQGAMASDWTTLAVALGSSELQRLDVHGTFARWVRVQCQSGGDLRLWEFQVFEDAETPVISTTEPSTTASTATTSTAATTATSQAQSTTSVSDVVTTVIPETTTVVTSTVSGPSTTTPFYGPNLAFQKPVLSSSFRSAMEHAYKAVDGDLDSQWASVAMNDQWLWVDLLGLYAVNRIVLLFGDVPQQFVLQTAPDGIKWTDLATVNGADGFISTEFSPPALTQWIRVVCQTACSIRELTIHGDVPGASTAPTTSSTLSPTTPAVSSTQEVTGTSSSPHTTSSGSTGTVNRVNLAQQRPVLASSQQLPDGHVSRMTDGLLNTQWASAVGDAQPWAWVDLLGLYTVAEVAVHWAADAAEYEIQTSLNGVQWTPISPRASALSGQTVRTVFPGNTPATQWIRIVCLSFGPTCSIKELFVYDVAGPDSATTAAPVTTALPASTAAPAENVALNKPVLASSSILPDEFASRAVDGLSSTQWRSAAGDQWIWVDLLGRYTLDHVRVQWGNQLPSSFNLETSFNAVTWASAVAQQQPESTSQRVDIAATTQWLRVYCTAGCSIQELQVYGSPATGRLLADEGTAPILV